jgi:hypothetical protein
MCPAPRSLPVALLVATLAAAAVPQARAVIIFDQPSQITSAPTGDQGFSSVAKFGNGSAVAVSGHSFLSVQHLPPATNDPVVLNGVAYHVTDWTNLPGSGIAILHVAETIPLAFQTPLYSNTADPAGIAVSLVGFGGPKGPSNNGTFDLSGHGWYWTSASPTQSWAANTLDGINSGYLHFNFTPLATVNQGMITAGDSGGGVFIHDAGTWKLAGLIEGVDGFYVSPTETDPFNYVYAAIYDPRFYDNSHTQTGLYDGDVGSLQLTTLASQGAYADQVAPRYAEIQADIAALEAVPEPATLALLALGAATLLTPRRR